MSSTESAPSPIRYEVKKHVASVRLCRADKRNAFSVRMLRELAEAYQRADDDPEVRVLVLSAEGDHFTGGLDLAEVGPHIAAGHRLFPRGKVDPLDLFPPYRNKPVVAAVQGFCLTIGIELMLAADLTIAADDATFAQMEVQRGILPFGGATIRFAERCGTGAAMRHLLTGDRFDAEEALRIGLVQEVTPRARLDEVAAHIAERIASQAPLAVRATRAAILRTRRPQAMTDELSTLYDQARELMDTEDAREGLKSFVERRKARFVGR